jgi:hypothetical protein
MKNKLVYFTVGTEELFEISQKPAVQIWVTSSRLMIWNYSL